MNDKDVMTRTLTLERRVLTGSLTTMLDIHALFTRHCLDLTARALGRDIEELVRDVYASYVATLRSQIYRRDAPAKQAPLDHIQVRGKWVDISLLSILRYLYGKDVDATRNPLTAEFKYR